MTAGTNSSGENFLENCKIEPPPAYRLAFQDIRTALGLDLAA
jgi:hypothetical protein